MPTNVFSGPRARFKINGEKVAYAGGVSGEENIDYEAVDLLDLLEVAEHVPVAYRAALNANIFRVINSSLKNLGIFPLKDEILQSGAMTASVEDQQTGRMAYNYQGVKAQGKSFDASARTLVSENASFVAIRCKDESEV